MLERVKARLVASNQKYGWVNSTIEKGGCQSNGFRTENAHPSHCFPMVKKYNGPGRNIVTMDVDFIRSAIEYKKQHPEWTYSTGGDMKHSNVECMPFSQDATVKSLNAGNGTGVSPLESAIGGIVSEAIGNLIPQLFKR